MSTRAMIVTYVSLVGIPLLGLVGILHSGRHLRAPLSVGGNWNLTADVSGWAGKPCGDLLAGIRQPAFSISQSGTVLVFTLNTAQAVTLAGTLRGTSLTAGALDSSAAGEACSPAEAIRVNAVVGKRGAQPALTGMLQLRSCPACAAVPFEAVRLASAKKGAQ